jgi:hypothetical protein
MEESRVRGRFETRKVLFKQSPYQAIAEELKGIFKPLEQLPYHNLPPRGRMNRHGVQVHFGGEIVCVAAQPRLLVF